MGRLALAGLRGAGKLSLPTRSLKAEEGASGGADPIWAGQLVAGDDTLEFRADMWLVGS